MCPSTVLIVSFAFEPSSEIGARRITALARFLGERGVRVLVVSAFGGQPVARGTELFPGVIALPVRRPPRPWLDLLVALKGWVRAHGAEDGAPALGAHEPNATGIAARLRDDYFRVVHFIDQFKKWSWRAAAEAARAGREHRAALLIASAPPHSTLLAGAWAARRLNIPFIADLRDPWSDTLEGAHPERRSELRLVRTLESWAMQRAAAITSTSASAAALLARRNPRLTSRMHVVRNGYDGAIAPALTNTGGRLSILYAGVLYLWRTPYPLLAALERLLSRPDVDSSRVRLTFMGDKIGSFSGPSLERWLQGKRCAAVVRVLPRQTPEIVAREVAQATVLLNLAQQQHLQVPAKTFEHLAAGREVLVIAESDCETAQAIAGVRGVTRVDQSDPEALEATLLDLYRRHAAGTALVPPEADVGRFSRALANERFAAILDGVAAQSDTHAVIPLRESF
jgi:hypothetical protein